MAAYRRRGTIVKKHKHKWTYFSGMATCACGKELLPDGTIRLANPKRWRSHRAAITARVRS